MTTLGTPAGLDVLLHNARRRAGLTQQQLADLSTVSVRTIRDMEQGRVQRPRRGTVLLLADAMRLGDATRSALQLAAGDGSKESVYREVFGPQCAVPPTPLRPLIGRCNELHALERLLRSEQERLVSVVGLPSVGKSRLAQEAAVLVHGRDRLPVLWVPVGPSGGIDGELVAGPLATLTGWVGELLATGGRHDELCTVIGEKPALLVLDGYEPSAVTDARLMGLLRSCTRLRVLVTANRPPRLPGGRLFPLAPLSSTGADPAGGGPGASLVAGRPAVELMLSYAGHMRPDLLPTDSVVREMTRVCQALDGLPGALEAAASWLLVYSPAQLADLAETEPLSLVDGVTPADAGSGPPLGERLAAVHAGLSPHLAERLGTLASLPDPWTVEEAAAVSGGPLPVLARDVHALLMLGLVRDLGTGPGGSTGFTVLRLVRGPARAHAGSPAGEGPGPEVAVVPPPARVTVASPAVASVRVAVPTTGFGPAHTALPAAAALGRLPRFPAPAAASHPAGPPGSVAASARSALPVPSGLSG